jgi:hypothetical protein
LPTALGLLAAAEALVEIGGEWFFGVGRLMIAVPVRQCDPSGLADYRSFAWQSVARLNRCRDSWITGRATGKCP